MFTSKWSRNLQLCEIFWILKIKSNVYWMCTASVVAKRVHVYGSFFVFLHNQIHIEWYVQKLVNNYLNYIFHMWLQMHTPYIHEKRNQINWFLYGFPHLPRRYGPIIYLHLSSVFSIMASNDKVEIYFCIMSHTTFNASRIDLPDISAVI